MNRPAWPARLAGRRTIRLRLTLTYSGLFLLAAAMLVAFTYVFVVRGLSTASVLRKPSQPLTVTEQSFKDACAKVLAAEKTKMALTPTEKGLISRCELSFRSGVVAGAQSQRDEATHQLLLYSLVGLGIMGALSGAVGWLVAGRALRPVHAITGAARRASEENLGERLALAGPPDELKELADTYDAMLARLDAAFASQRRFVANASHELRTPLTVMRTAIDVTLAKPGRTPAQLEDMAAEVRGAVDRAEALIEALLTLARSDRGTAAMEPADLAVLAEDALDAAAPAIRARSAAAGDVPADRAHPRRSGAAGPARGQRGGQRGPAQRRGRLDPGGHRDAGRAGVPDGHQRRPGHRGGRYPAAVRAVPAAVRSGGQRARDRAGPVHRAVGSHRAPGHGHGPQPPRGRPGRDGAAARRPGRDAREGHRGGRGGVSP